MAKKKKVTPETADQSEDIFASDDFEPGKIARIEVQRVPSETEGKKWDYYWMIFAANGVPVATGVEPHHRLNDLKTTVSRIAGYVNKAPYIRLY